MIVHSVGSRPSPRAARPPLLDVAAEVLVADPSAPLAKVAEAAGIGRTTLHKSYATREDLLTAVGHRAIDLWQQAVDSVAGREPGGEAPADPERAAVSHPDGGLAALTAAMIPIGPQLAFLWRTPSFDHVTELGERWMAAERRCLAVLKQAQQRGVLAPDVPDWWLLNTFYSLVYVAAESVRSGDLAPRDAPDLVLATFMHGIGATPPPRE
jgi:AcrR family transcriptional regulator